MQNIFLILIHWFMLILFTIYSFNNVKIVIEVEQSNTPLIVLGIFGILTFLGKSLLEIRISIRKSFFLLIMFFMYVLMQGFIIDYNYLKSLTLGRSGGIIYGVAYGFIVKLIVHSIFVKIRRGLQLKKVNLAFAVVFFSFITLYVYKISSFLLGFGRYDIFLISYEYSNLYQTPAAYISIFMMVLSYLLVLLFTAYNNSNFSLKKISLSIIFILYFICSLKLMLLSQLLGSNNGLVVVITFFLLTVFFVQVNFIKKIKRKINRISRMSLLKFIGINKFFFRQAVLLLSCIVGVLYVVIKITDFDLLTLRIFNFGFSSSLVSSSFVSRFELIQNFIIQFFYNPIFGNLNVDRLTTGTGTYAHSLPLSLLSHTGLIGFLIFIALVYSILSELSSEQKKTPHYFFISSRTIYLYKIYWILLVLIMATFATFFNWLPLWFSLGFCANYIVLQKDVITRKN
ncbi:MAG: hypothetical protein D3910_05925 [Candidatus Electrothrix sp. ATG2]|nr:hypothetical protein [Candidatus Electrothrix sp. ATG2]